MPANDILWDNVEDGIEPLYDTYKIHLEELNRILRDTGEFVEGNNFYLDGITPVENQMPVEEFRPRRRAHVTLAQNSAHVVEVGFNAGHSALLLLTANSDLIYTGFDICTHGYTERCFDYLKSVFGNRIRLTKGDSVQTLPTLYQLYPDVLDQNIGWIVDGCHLIDVAREDAKHVIEELAKDNQILLFDDIDASPGYIKEMMDTYIQNKNLVCLKEISTLVHNVGPHAQYTFIQGVFQIKVK